MSTDQRNLPVAEGDEVVVSVNAGMLNGMLVKLPSGLTLSGQAPGTPQVALVQVLLHVQVLPGGLMPGVFKLAEIPESKAKVH